MSSRTKFLKNLKMLGVKNITEYHDRAAQLKFANSFVVLLATKVRGSEGSSVVTVEEDEPESEDDYDAPD